MNEYYGAPTTPTDDYLAHYGIRGMKWGVQRAKKKPLYSGRNKRLDRQFVKASKKLEKLNQRTDIELQNKKADKLKKTSKIALGMGLAGIGGISAATGLSKRSLKKHYNELGQIPGVKVQQISGTPITSITYTEMGPKSWDAVEKANQRYNHRQKKIGIVGGISSAVGIGGLGTALGSALASRHVRKRTTKEGHAKAVAERDSFKNEMKKQFAGTAYANKISGNSYNASGSVKRKRSSRKA